MSSAIPPRPKALAQIQTSESDSSRGPSPQPTHVSVPQVPHSLRNGHRVLRSATVGYVAPQFEGKTEQIKSVKAIIQQGGWLPDALIDEQIEWFYEKLGIDDVYFHIETPDVIANQITSLYAAKVAAHSREDKQ